ncbi:hypothetical protein OIDMADRAFT_100460 [Oidiodendron maius Zn]|uniref:Zn(2)-C6 fungal-type domain-containing protein n=1 Tax=Oidiodendron maius (strain Zn) TaxID=913774 RepID=A0A0C3E3I9_OIDMZ|nr:hypothetical protein OIDMADRAFT_100460 [Oidiodendron maius Zn]
MSSNKPVFVDGMNPHGPIQDGHHSRLYHKKSRTGCQRCRLRRVKCNEAKPACRHCERHGVCCIYDRLDPPTKHSTESSPDEPLESRRRRMVELELMHFYITETGPSIAFDKNSSYDLFVKAIPRAAIKSDSLLYSVYAIAALHQTKTTGGQGPSIPSPTAVAMARENHQIYSQLAFQRHHQDLAQISHANVDMLIMTANIMRLIAFVVLSERPLVPYMAPLHWLKITKSHAQVFLAAWDLVGDNSSTQTARLIKATPVVWDYDERQGADKREGLEHLLQPVLGIDGIDGHDEDQPSLWDDGVRRAYESTLSYIGGIWQSVQRNDPLGPIGRRLILFPILVEQRFIDLVGEAKPRALVILAHYFALVTIIKSFWFVGNTGLREVRSIAAYLPAHWQGSMELPLRLVNEGLPYSQTAAS